MQFLEVYLQDWVIFSFAHFEADRNLQQEKSFSYLPLKPELLTTLFEAENESCL